MGKLWVATCYMKSVPGNNDYSMFINEQPEGGFKWEFLDYEPDDKQNYSPVYICKENPRLKIQELQEENNELKHTLYRNLGE